MDLEKSYWGLKGSNGKFDLPILEDIMCPPLSKQICNSECLITCMWVVCTYVITCTCT